MSSLLGPGSSAVNRALSILGLCTAPVFILWTRCLVAPGAQALCLCGHGLLSCQGLSPCLPSSEGRGSSLCSVCWQACGCWAERSTSGGGPSSGPCQQMTPSLRGAGSSREGPQAPAGGGVPAVGILSGAGCTGPLTMPAVVLTLCSLGAACTPKSSSQASSPRGVGGQR